MNTALSTVLREFGTQAFHNVIQTSFKGEYMRKTPILTLAILSAAMIPAIQQVHAADKTIDGIVSDTMCGKKHMMPGKTDAQCIQECIKSGSTYAVKGGAKPGHWGGAKVGQ